MIDRILLFPYYCALKLRHCLYDRGYKKSYGFDTPVISVGNVTVGGTGKTPHVELLVRELSQEHRVAVISRGYKRKSKGYREVLVDDRSTDVGDEPLQIKRKFPKVRVVVDSSRREAIEKLSSLPEGERPTMFILDDAFQHREVIPSTSILLVDYNRPIFSDRLLPMGRLRDLPERVSAADIVIVTKVPWWDEYPDETLWKRKLHLREDQKLYFSRIEYCHLKGVFPECDMRYAYSPKAVIFTGIANNQPMVDHLVGTFRIEQVLTFSDHKNFSKGDIRKIESAAKRFRTSALITTEKDAQRLLQNPYLSDELKKRLLYLEIKVTI